MRIFWILLLSSLAVAQGTKVPGPLTVTPDPNGTTQESIVLVDISKPVPTPAANQYILTFDSSPLCPTSGKCYQESDNGGAYHALKGKDGIDGTNGVSPTIAIGTTSTFAYGFPATVTNVGDGKNAVFDFGIPAGKNGTDGLAATLGVGSVTSGSAASVTNSGSESAALFDFVLPKGDKGIPGLAATVGIGTVTSGATPAVTNVGTGNNAMLNFVLQPGPKGADSFPVGSYITVVVTGCNTVAAGRTCVFKRTK